MTSVTALTFVFLYQANALDSRNAVRQAALLEASASPVPGARLSFTATAYCKGTITASGAAVRSGIAAADPALLPVGSVIQVDSLPDKYNGVYTIMDTGPAVQGRHIDIYMWSCYEALDFGRRPTRVTVLRLGWSPEASAPRLVDRLFKQREAARLAENAGEDGTPVPASNPQPPGQPDVIR